MLMGQSRNTLNAQAFPQGADWMRVHDTGCTNWGLVEKQQGIRNWTGLDAHLAAAEAKGIPSLYVFCNTPPWAAQCPINPPPGLKGPGSNCPPNVQALIDFVTALVKHVTRADGSLRISAWEVWNEANFSGFWCGSDEQLLQLQQIVYRIVKAADPHAIVTTPSCVYSWSTNNIVTALSRWLPLGFQNYADAIGIHGYQVPIDSPAANIGPTIDSIKSLLAQYGVALPIWDTEFSYGRSLPADPGQWVRDSLNIRAQKGIAAGFWYQCDNATYGTQINTNGTLTPAGQAWLDAYNSVHPLPAVSGIAQAA